MMNAIINNGHIERTFLIQDIRLVRKEAAAKRTKLMTWHIFSLIHPYTVPFQLIERILLPILYAIQWTLYYLHQYSFYYKHTNELNKNPHALRPFEIYVAEWIDGGNCTLCRSNINHLIRKLCLFNTVRNKVRMYVIWHHIRFIIALYIDCFMCKEVNRQSIRKHSNECKDKTTKRKSGEIERNAFVSNSAHRSMFIKFYFINGVLLYQLPSGYRLQFHNFVLDR